MEDYSKVCNNIVYKLINRDSNAQLLSRVPHVNYLDLAIVFYYVLPKEEGTREIWCTLIENSHMDSWSIGVEELMNRASVNTSRLLGLKIQNIVTTLAECSQGREDFKISELEDLYVPLYVATNRQNIYGAAVIIYKDLLRALAEKFKSDLYIIPCSVHEVIIFRAIKGCQVDTSNLKDLISQVNRNEIPKDEVLSDSLYYYSRLSNELAIA